MSSIEPKNINTTNKVIQFNNKNVPWAINVDEIIHDTSINNRSNLYPISSSNKLSIISKQKDIDISSAHKLNLNSANDFNLTSANNLNLTSTNDFNLSVSNKIILNGESSFNNLAKFRDVSMNNLSISNDLLINNQLQIDNTILNSKNIRLNPTTNQLILFNKYKFELDGNDLRITAINSEGKSTVGSLKLPSGSTQVTNVDDYLFNKSTLTNSVIKSTSIGIGIASDASIAKFTDVSINNLSISNDLFINELSLNTLKSYEIYLNNNFRTTSSDSSINLIIELSNIDSSLNKLNTNISNLDTSMKSKFQITDTSVNSLESKLNNFIFDDASFGTIDISKNIKLEYIDNKHSLLFVDNNKDLSSNSFIHFNEVSGIMFFDNSFAMKIPHSIQNTSHDISGLIRYNTNTNNFEGYNGLIWKKFLDTSNNKIDILDNGDISFNKIYFNHNTGDISCVNLYNNYIDASNVLIKNDLSINNTLHINNHIIKNDNNYLVIDPQPAGNEKGTLKIKGNLIVDGSQTIIHSTRVDISDTNINLGINAQNKSHLNDAGIDISNVARFRYNNERWNTNIGLNISGDLDASNIIGTNIKINNFNTSNKYVNFFEENKLLTIDGSNQSYIVDNITLNTNINDISCINFINGTQSIIEISSSSNINIIGSENNMNKDYYYFNYASDLLLETGNKGILCISKINNNHYISCSIYSK